jgi:DNA-directed RNA polymerase specialized sigma24 family protein
MASDGSVTRLIVMLKDGNRAASQQLWEVYFGRLVGLARARLRGTPGRMADEEDVAISACESFYRRAERGQFPQLEDRDAFWKLEGYTNAEIAARLGCVTQTVERKLRVIRTVWSNEAPT